MDENITAVVTTGIVAKKMATSSAVFGPMVLFSDPAYLTIALIGAFVSTVSRAYDIYILKEKKEEEGEEFSVSMIHETGKAALVGSFVTLILFMLLNQLGIELLNNFFGTKWTVNMLPSFWLVVAIALGTESVTLWDMFWGWAKRDRK